MSKYTVQDSQTGRTITFDWSGQQPPTDSDMEQVFAEAKSFKPENTYAGMDQSGSTSPSKSTSPAFTREGLVENVVRPVLGGLGMGVGGALGAAGGTALGGPVGGGAGAILGGAAGYSAGEQAANWMGGKQVNHLDPQTYLTGAEYATGGELLGPVAKLAGRTAMGIGGLAKDVWQKGPKNVFNEIRDKYVGRKAQQVVSEAASTTPEATAQIDKNRLESERLEKEIPNLRFNLGQQGGDPNYLSIARQQGQQPGLGTALSEESVMGQNAALRNYSNAQLVGEGDVRDFLGVVGEKQRKLGAASESATTAAEKVASDITGMEETEIGRRVRRKAAKSKAESSEYAGELKEAIPGDTKIKMKPLWDKLKEMYVDYNQLVERLSATPTSTMSRAKAAMTPEAEEASGLINPRTNKPFAAPTAEPPADMSLTDIRKLMSQLASGKRAAKANGDHELAFKFGQIQDAVDDTLALAAESGESEGVEALKTFRDYWRETHIPKYRHGPTGEIFETKFTGEEKVADASVGSHFFKEGREAGATAADGFVRTFGDDPEARSLIRDYAAQSLSKFARNPATGELNSTRIATWFYKHKVALDKLGLSDEFSSLRGAQKLAEAAKKSEAEFNSSSLARALQQDPDKAINSVLLTGEGKKSSINTLTEMVKLAETDKIDAALDGLRAGVGRAFQRKVSTAARDLSKLDMESFAKVKKFVEDMRPALEQSGLYKKEQLKAWDNVHDALGIIAKQAGPHTGYAGSQTADILTRLAVGGGVKIAGLPHVTLRAYSMLTKSLKDRINDTVTRAVFDPRFAEALQKFAKIPSSPKAAKEFMDTTDMLIRITPATVGPAPESKYAEPAVEPAPVTPAPIPKPKDDDTPLPPVKPKKRNWGVAKDDTNA